MICWTLGITEHHNAVDNVLSLINLSLLTGHVGVYGSGVNPLRGQNNVQGGGDMGAIPNKLPGFQDIETDAAARERFERAWGVPIIPKYGWHLTQMFHAMERGDLRALYVIGENPANSEADATHATPLLENLDCLIVQDIFMTKTAELADVVFPASAAWAEAEGTVTNSERRVQRVRKALDPPGDAKDDIWIIVQLAKRLGVDWGEVTAHDAWEELRTLSPDARGDVLRAARGARRHPVAVSRRVPSRARCSCTPASGSSTTRRRRATKAPFSVVIDDPPVDGLDDEFPLRLTTGRRLDSYNTGVQSGGYTSPLRRPRVDRGLAGGRRTARGGGGGARVVTSRRGSVEAPVHIDPACARAWSS